MHRGPNQLAVPRPRLHFALALAAVLLATLVVLTAAAQSVDLYVPPEPAVAPVRVAPPLRLAATARPAPLATMAPATEGAAELVEAVRQWNRAGRLPARIGFVRPLATPPEVRFTPDLTGAAPYSTRRPTSPGALGRSDDGGRVWGGEVRVGGAHRLRLRLTDLHLPAGVRMWVYGEAGEVVGPFGLELAYEGALWTPSVAGPTVRLEVELPPEAAEDAARFRVAAAGEILDPVVAWPHLGAVSETQDTSCLIDVQCVGTSTFPVVDLVEQAIAHLQFPIDEQFIGVCTGGLLNDTADSGTPYLLTANHCFSDQAAASGLEAFFDVKSDGCNGSAPSIGSVPHTTGATLLASGVSSDYTLVRLSSIPTGRVFLGWNANPGVLQQGTVLHRVHHPVPGQTIFTQTYTRLGYLPDGFNTCSDDGEGRVFNDPDLFHHEELLEGGSLGGSSGAPLILSNGQVVGQLFGACGPEVTEGCDDRNHSLDGAFSNTFPAVQSFLVADTGPGEPCTPDATTLCLVDDRFQARLRWRTNQGTVGDGKAVQVTPTPDNSGLMYFFNNPDNWELLVKVLNGCPITGHYWVFFAATTNVEFTLTVTDTERNEVHQYFNPLGKSADAVTDTMAFATCP